MECVPGMNTGVRSASMPPDAFAEDQITVGPRHGGRPRTIDAVPHGIEVPPVRRP
jgi:hypothetical protein